MYIKLLIKDIINFGMQKMHRRCREKRH